jgi:hypothetical protein
MIIDMVEIGNERCKATIKTEQESIIVGFKIHQETDKIIVSEHNKDLRKMIQDWHDSYTQTLGNGNI